MVGVFILQSFYDTAHCFARNEKQGGGVLFACHPEEVRRGGAVIPCSP